MHSVAQLLGSLSPDPALLDCDGGVLSGDEVARLAADVSGLLLEAGVPAGGRIAVGVPAGMAQAVATLGTMLRHVAVPVAPALPRDRVVHDLERTGCAAVLVGAGTSPLREAAATLGLPMIELSATPTRWPRPDARPTCETAAGDAHALLLHTSGTTGTPKLVPLTHTGLLAGARAVAATCGLTERDRCLGLMPLFHIHGLVATLLAPLISGGSTICAPVARLAEIPAWLADLEPTWWSSVPTVHQAILAATEGQPELGNTKLRLIRSSSASLPPTILEQLEARFGVPVIEAYGMTEASHQITSNALPPGTRAAGWVGRAAGAEIAVLTSTGEIATRDATGEVVVSGPGLTHGYLGDPAAWEAATERGWFRTGDTGELDGTGALRLIGRRKEMINRGGETIPPVLIDNALLSHPEVAQAAAFAVPHPTLGEDVGAAVVLRPGSRVTMDELIAHVAQQLSPAETPRRIRVLDELPVGPTGKLQRSRLAALLAPVTVSPSTAAELTAREAAVLGLLRRALGTDDVGVDDDFFTSGGDSLRAVRLLADIDDVLGRTLPIAAFATLAVSARRLAGLLDADSVQQWWLERLADAPAETNLPADRPRGAVASSDRGLVRRKAPPVSVAHQLAGLALALGRSGAGDDIVLGLLSTGGDTVPVRVLSTPGLDADAWVGQVEASLAGTDGVRSAAEMAVALGHPVIQGMHPLFQVTLAPDGEPGDSAVDLACDLAFGTSGEEVWLSYAGARFDRETAEALLDRWVRCVELLGAGGVVDDLDVLSAAEHAQLDEWEFGGPAPALAAASLGEALVSAFAGAPDELAVVTLTERLTRHELAGRSAALAAELAARGVGPGSLVGFNLPRDSRAVVTIVAILRCGAVVVPLPDGPAARLEGIAAAGLALVITVPGSLAATTYERTGQAVMLLPSLLDVSPDPYAACVAVTLDDPAYVLHTSGSTGVPKGVVLTHGGLLNVIAATAELVTTEARAGVLAASNLTFDLGNFELLLPLVAGGTLVLIDDIRSLVGEVDTPDHPVTLISTGPSAMAELLRSSAVPTSVGTLLLAGEVLPPAMVESVAALGHVDRVVNAYGPTESTMFCTVWKADPARDVSPTIGHPIAGSRVLVLDQAGKRVPPGVEGEIVNAGCSPAAGYLGMPEATAERFPVIEGVGRTNRTGDYGRWDRTGALHYLGRRDRQVKVRGLRIEPAEIEAALLRQPGVLEAVVSTVGIGSARSVTAHVRLVDPVTVSDVRASLASVLPRYLLPDVITAVDEFPRTTSGKPDRVTLAARASAGAGGSASAEQAMLVVWRNLLPGITIGLDDDFFQIGGQSLLAMRMLADFETATGTALPLSTLSSEAVTIRQLVGAPADGADLSFPVNLSGSQPPLYIVMSDEGGLLALRHIPAVLGPDQPVIGLLANREQHYGDNTVTGLARSLADVVIEQQPSGPIRLAGHSLGGLIAHAMAADLERAGRQVEVVLLLDAPSTRLRKHSHPIYVAHRLRMLGARGAAETAVPFINRHLFSRARPNAGRVPAPPALGPDEYDYAGGLRLRAAHTEPAVRAPMHLIVASHTASVGADKTLGWKKYSTPVTVHTVEGDHLSILRQPDVSQLAAMIRSVLARL